MKRTLKTHRLKEAQKTTSKILELLCYLEDLNSYRNNIISKTINEFEDLKWVGEE